MVNFDKELGLKIKNYRRKLGLQAKKLAQQINISPSYLNLIESGKRKIDGDLLLKISQELRIDFSDLSLNEEIDINNSDKTIENNKEIDINTSDNKGVYKTRVLDLENLSSDIEKRILPLLPEFAKESVKSFFKEFH